MKYKYFLLPIAGMFIIAAIFVSCSKQDQTELTSSPPEISQSKADILIENKIRAFKSKLEHLRENPQFKSGETMAVDSVVWYVEATLNYTYARAGVPFDRILRDSAKITIPVNNQGVLLADVDLAYQQVKDSLSAKYHAIASEDKSLLVVDVEAVTAADNSTELHVKAGFAEGSGVLEYGQFGTTDYWYWGRGFGKCDQYIGQNLGEDASTELDYYINHPISVYPGKVYFTDEETLGYFDPWDYPDPNNPFGYYRLFALEFIEPPLEHPCLSPDEMNYYLYEGVVYIMEDNKPAGKHLVSGVVEWDQINDLGIGAYLHKTMYTYGIRHIASEPPIDL